MRQQIPGILVVLILVGIVNSTLTIGIITPTNTTYYVNSTSFSFNFGSGDGCGYTLDNGAFNSTTCEFSTLLNLADGRHTILANDTVNNLSDSVLFYIDTSAPPVITGVAMSSNNINPAYVGINGTVTLLFNSSEVLSEANASIAGHPVVVGGNGQSFQASYVMNQSDSPGTVSCKIDYANNEGNVGPEVTASNNSIIFDKTIPVLTSAVMYSSNANPALAKAGDTITLNFTSNENLSSESVKIDGETAVITNLSNTQYEASYQLQTNDNPGVIPYTVDFANYAENPGVELNANSSITYNAPPTFTNVTMSSNNVIEVLVSTSLIAAYDVYDNIANPEYANIGNTVTVVFDVNEPISSETVTIAGHSVSVTPVNSTEFKAGYVMTGSDTSGTIPFSIGISDPAGNTATTTALISGGDVVFLPSAAGFDSVTMESNAPNPNYAGIGTIINISFQSEYPLQSESVTIDGHSATITNSSETQYTASYQMTGSDTSGYVPFLINYVDAAGNAGNDTAITNGPVIIFQATTPVISSVMIMSNETDSSVAYPGDIIQVSFTANEELGSETISIAGHLVSVNNVGGYNYQAIYQMQPSDVKGNVPFIIYYEDVAGNSGPEITTAGSGVTFKAAPAQPAVIIPAPTLPSTEPISIPQVEQNPPVVVQSNTTITSTETTTAQNGLAWWQYVLGGVAIIAVIWWIYKGGKAKGLEGI